jgi:hypothetical protein
MQNAIKLENISNLLHHRLVINVVTKVSTFCYSWPTHINGMYVCVLGIPKDKFSKQMKKKILRYRIIRIKRIFFRSLLMYNLDQVTHMLT